MQVTSTFGAAIQPLPRAEKAAIPHMKDEMQGFHMNPIAEVFIGEMFSALSQYMISPLLEKGLFTGYILWWENLQLATSGMGKF